MRYDLDHRAALLLLLNQRLTTLVDAMPAAQAGDMRSVHQARVATRRLREALPVLRASVNDHALGRVRAAGAADDPGARVRCASSTSRCASRRARDAQNVVSRRALGRVRADDRAGAARAPARDAGRDHAGQDREAATPPWRSQLPAQRRRSRPPRSQKPSAGRHAAPPADGGDRARRRALSADRLHAVRVAAKKLRYALEIERELKRSRGTARITQLKRLQDLLGRMHDFEILIDRTRQVQAELAGSDRKLTTELDTLIATLEDECRTRSRRPTCAAARPSSNCATLLAPRRRRHIVAVA